MGVDFDKTEVDRNHTMPAETVRCCHVNQHVFTVGQREKLSFLKGIDLKVRFMTLFMFPLAIPNLYIESFYILKVFM